jgi:hypothetical protein
MARRSQNTALGLSRRESWEAEPSELLFNFSGMLSRAERRCENNALLNH